MGDFNGDGKTDILWRDAATGDVAVWLMNGTIVDTGILSANIANNWQIQGIGDFNGDGKADIFWRNHLTNEVGVWLVNGKTLLEYSITRDNQPPSSPYQ